MRGRRGRAPIAGLTAILLVVAGWGAASDRAQAASTAAFEPTYEEVTCPNGVNPEEGSTLTCGYLTVLENRAEPEGGTIRLFITVAEPASGSKDPDPIFSPGRDLGWAAPRRTLGYRADRPFIIMDQRGVGYSQPSLACPEVEGLTDPSFGVTLGTPEMTTSLLAAVGSCRDRLTARGIDLDAYNLAEMAADAEDLRVALGIEEWNLITYGSASSISFEIMRGYPETIRAAVFDSPVPPHVDRFTGAIIGTEWAFGQVVKACKRQPSCDSAFPHLRKVWNRSLTALDGDPPLIRDEELSVVVDDTTAIRYLRNNLAQGINETTDLAEFPWAVYELRENGWLNGGPAGDEVGWAAAPPLHVGYDLQWGDAAALNLGGGSGTGTTFEYGPRLGHGTFYSFMCHDEVPFVDETALAEAAGAAPWYVGAYVDHPFGQICDRWGVDAAEHDPHERPISDIPVLMVVGRFDPYSPLDLVRRSTRRLTNAWVVDAGNRSHNALSTDCTIGIRDDFIKEPTAPPDTTCVTEMETAEPVTFVRPPARAREARPGEAVITTVAGDGAFGSAGDGDPATEAQLASPAGVALGPDGSLFVVELYGMRVRVVDTDGRITTAVGAPTRSDGAVGAAKEVRMLWPTAVEVDAEGNLFVGGGEGTHRMIIRVDPTGAVTRIAGTGEQGFSGDGGSATDATSTWVRDIAVDTRGNVYFTDYENNRIRRVDTSGIITTVAGTSEQGTSGDGGAAIHAKLDHPSGIVVDTKGNLYVADRSHRVRRIGQRGIIRTVAGTGEEGYSGDGGPALEAKLGANGLAFDAGGNLYISDAGCACVRMVDTHGVITTIVGTGTPGFSGDGVHVTSARLREPAGIVVGPDGSLYIADLLGNSVRRVDFP